ncbi:hypothetical protein A3I58_00415 [Candidatus Peregrinibacteria bacterium RIFCSPLOWO2_02_FULL_39_10]|nr:MAG: hypothetical protein A3I58_00415 [Candidatus Peregrinibacteria bacterium RIFCSPLOWO2_02_FULL_39_10]
MNKLLALLWVIIIAGTAFIAIIIYKPEGSEEAEISPPIDKTLSGLYKEPSTKNEGKQPLQIQEESPKTFAEYIAKGNTYFSEGYYEDAEKNYEKAAGLNTNSEESLKAQLGIVKAKINSRNIKDAKEILWTISDDSAETKYYKAIISILAKENEEAKKYFKEIVEAEKDKETEEKTEFAQKSQKFLDTFDIFSYYKEGDPLFLQLLLAKSLTETEENGAAIPLLFDILNQKNNYHDAWIVLGYAFLNTNKAKEAVDALEQAKDLNPDNPQSLFYLGLAYFADGKTKEAIHYLEEADEKGYEPKEHINLKLGDLYTLNTDFKKAAERYESVLAENQNNIDVFVRSVWLNLEKTNNPQKALKLAKLALENHQGNPMSYNLVGWTYIALNDYEKAQENLSQALSINKNFDAAWLNLGWMYEKQGKTSLAKASYKKAYGLGKGGSIGNLAAIRFSKLTKQELKNFSVNISSP